MKATHCLCLSYWYMDSFLISGMICSAHYVIRPVPVICVWIVVYNLHIITSYCVYNSYHSSCKECRNSRVKFFIFRILCIVCFNLHILVFTTGFFNLYLFNDSTWPCSSLSPLPMRLSLQIYNGWADSNRKGLRQRPTGVYGRKYCSKRTKKLIYLNFVLHN